MTEHDQRVCLGQEQESLGKLGQPPQKCARLEEVLTPKPADPELDACLRADAAGEPSGATNLGVLLEERGDRHGALAAYRRADRRGDAIGAFNLGCLLTEMGELPAAQAAFERADERGDGAAASNLGVLLEQRGDLDGALAAYRRADERGDGSAAYNLGLLLRSRGDREGARAAYRRAAERGEAEVRERAGQAEAELRRAEPRPVPALEPRRSRLRMPRLLALGLVALVAIVWLRRRRAT